MVTYVSYHNKPTPQLIECKHLFLMQLKLFFKVGYVCTIPKGVESNRSTQFAVLILCHDSTGCGEMGDYFAIEADTMIDIVRLT